MVYVLVFEPIWKSASPSTGSGASALVTPNPATCSWPWWRTPIAMPGIWCSCWSAATRATNCAKSGAAV